MARSIFLCFFQVKAILFALALFAPYVLSSFHDGFVNKVLPGADERDLPNLPFIIDSNRWSDGVSYISPHTPTSPSFPKYNSTLENPVWRKTRELLDLRLRNISADGPLTTNSTDFIVDSSKFWNPSGIRIGEEGVYSIEVVGDQFWVDSRIRIDAEGYDSYYDAVSKCHVAAGQCRSYLQQRRRLPQQRWMRLVCGVGDFTWKLQVVAGGGDRYMPVRAEDIVETTFAVGQQRTFTASTSGELVCFANDADGLYQDNQGSLVVTVSVLKNAPETLIVMR